MDKTIINDLARPRILFAIDFNLRQTGDFEDLIEELGSKYETFKVVNEFAEVRIAEWDACFYVSADIDITVLSKIHSFCYAFEKVGLPRMDFTEIRASDRQGRDLYAPSLDDELFTEFEDPSSSLLGKLRTTETKRVFNLPGSDQDKRFPATLAIRSTNATYKEIIGCPVGTILALRTNTENSDREGVLLSEEVDNLGSWFEVCLRRWNRIEPGRFAIEGWQRAEQWLTTEEAAAANEISRIRRERNLALDAFDTQIEAKQTELEHQRETAFERSPEVANSERR